MRQVRLLRYFAELHVPVYNYASGQASSTCRQNKIIVRLCNKMVYDKHYSVQYYYRKTYEGHEV